LILLRVDSGAEPAPRPTAVEDRWILSRLQRIKMETADRLARFDFSHAALGLYDFVYGELCDWYLEWVKPRIESDDRQSLSSNLLYVLRETVAVAHPVIPFVTEEIWSYLPAGAGDGAAERRGGGEGSALLAGYHMPPADPALIDQEAEEAIERVIAAVQALRAWRNEVGAPTRQSVRARLDAEGYESTRELIERMARFEFTVDGAGGLVDGQVPVGEGTAGEGAAGEGAAGEGPAGGEPLTTVDIPGGSVAVLAVDADLEAARNRREARRRSLESDIERAERKLANREFVEKAPAAVVEAERAKLASLRAQLEAL
ncbi:MAG TPA: class I tRNA ligase family protein, partial [Solirubrobacteraceae bacterium]|nr:class I tRNA ligase family protein [Solirubrobacteraceae bacterium]